MQWATLVIFALLPIFLAFLAALKKDEYKPANSLFSRQLWNCYDIILVLCFFSLIRLINWLLVWKNIINASHLNIYGTLIFLIVPPTALYIIFYLKYGFKIPELGLRLKNCLPKVIIGLRVSFLVTFMYFLISLLIGDDRLLLGISRWYHKFGGIEMPLDQLFVFSFSILIIAPIVEESIFRGVMYGPFSRKFGYKGSIVLTALIWAIWHNDIRSIAGLIIVGIILAYVYAKTQSLIPNTIVHIMNNFISFITFIYLWLFSKGILHLEGKKFRIFSKLVERNRGKGT